MRWIAFLLVMVTLAGCSEDAAPAADPDAENFDELDLSATSTTGVIRGLVIDNAIVPVAGATVVLLGQDLETTTTETGAFGFKDLPEGTYFLQVSKVGFEGTQSSADVKAGVAQPPIVKIQLQRDPGSVPYATYLHYQGYIGCAFKAANYVFPNQCSAAGDPDKNEVLDFGTTQDPTLLQTEIVWKATQEIGKQLGTIQYVQDADGARQRIGNVWGPSPLICTVTPEAVCDNGDGTGGGGDGLNTTGFPGQFFASVYTACYPQCAIGAVGAGFVFQQDYDLYSTAFFNFLPPEGWTLTSDGQAEPPQ